VAKTIKIVDVPDKYQRTDALDDSDRLWVHREGEQTAKWMRPSLLSGNYVELTEDNTVALSAWGVRLSTGTTSNDSGFRFDSGGDPSLVLKSSEGNESYVENTSNDLTYSIGGTLHCVMSGGEVKPGVTGASGTTLGSSSTRWYEAYFSNLDVSYAASDLIPDQDSWWELGTTDLRWADLYVDDVTVTASVSVGGTLTAGSVGSNLTPSANNTYDLAVIASGNRWRDLALSRNADIDGTLNVQGSAIFQADMYNTQGAFIKDTGGTSTTVPVYAHYSDQSTGVGFGGGGLCALISESEIILYVNTAREVIVGTSGYRGTLRPYNSTSTSYCGTSTARWTQGYFGTVHYNTATGDSDVRLKTDIVDSIVGLDFAKQLRPVSYRWKEETAQEIVEELTASGGVVRKRVEKLDENGEPISQKGSTVRHGFIAQEVEKASEGTPFQAVGYDELEDKYGLCYDQLHAVSIKAIQELSEQIEALTKRIEALEA